MDGIAIEKLSALAAVCFIAIFTMRWLLGSFVDRLKAIEVAVNEVNESVNHRHEKDGDQGRTLYDLAVENNKRIHKVESELKSLTDWQSSYRGGPLDHGDKVKQFVEQMAGCAEKIDRHYEDLKQFAIDIGCPLKGGKKTDKQCGHDNPPSHSDPPDGLDRQQDY